MRKLFASFVAAVALALAGGTASAKDLRSIGVSVSTLSNPYFTAMVNGIASEAKTINPEVRVTTVSADYDLGKQFNEIDNFIGAGVDLILLSASDPKAIAPEIKRAEAAGIVVIAVDVSADGADATVQTDNLKAGEMGCAYLAHIMHGKGNAIILNGPQVSSIVQRVQGCKAMLAKSPGITLLSSNQDAKASDVGGLAVMQDLLTRFPNVEGVFSITDQQTLGAALAMRQLDRTGISIVSVDGAPDVVPEIRGDSPIVATMAQDPRRIGRMGVDIGNAILNGKHPAETTILIPPVLVTRETVTAYKGW